MVADKKSEKKEKKEVLPGVTIRGLDWKDVPITAFTKKKSALIAKDIIEFLQDNPTKWAEVEFKEGDAGKVIGALRKILAEKGIVATMAERGHLIYANYEKIQDVI